MLEEGTNAWLTSRFLYLTDAFKQLYFVVDKVYSNNFTNEIRLIDKRIIGKCLQTMNIVYTLLRFVGTCSHILTKSYRKPILQNEWTVNLVRIRFRCVLEKFSDKTIILLRSIGRKSKQLTFFKVSNALIPLELKPLSNHCSCGFYFINKLNF